MGERDECQLQVLGPCGAAVAVLRIYRDLKKRTRPGRVICRFSQQGPNCAVPVHAARNDGRRGGHGPPAQNGRTRAGDCGEIPKFPPIAPDCVNRTLGLVDRSDAIGGNFGESPQFPIPVPPFLSRQWGNLTSTPVWGGGEPAAVVGSQTMPVCKSTVLFKGVLSKRVHTDCGLFACAKSVAGCRTMSGPHLSSQIGGSLGCCPVSHERVCTISRGQLQRGPEPPSGFCRARIGVPGMQVMFCCTAFARRCISGEGAEESRFRQIPSNSTALHGTKRAQTMNS
eukprot:gene19279-biopygen5488